MCDPRLETLAGGDKTGYICMCIDAGPHMVTVASSKEAKRTQEAENLEGEQVAYGTSACGN